jgi:hypothetical protein
LSLADEVKKKKLPLQLQLRVKQVLQAVSKAQLDALLGGPAGTSGLSTGSFYQGFALNLQSNILKAAVINRCDYVPVFK